MDFRRFHALCLGTHFGTFLDKNLKSSVKSVKKTYLEKRNEKVMKRDPPKAHKVVFYLSKTSIFTNPAYPLRVTKMSSVWGHFE